MNPDIQNSDNEYSFDELLILIFGYVSLFLIFSRFGDFMKSLCELYPTRISSLEWKHTNGGIILSFKSFITFISLLRPIISGILILKLVQPSTQWLKKQKWGWKFIAAILLGGICWIMRHIIDFGDKTNDSNTIANPPSIIN